MRTIISLSLTVLFVLCFGGNTKAGELDSICYLKVHFLYGSRPMKKFKHVERRWFGGKLGGHVGIEIDSGQILHFLPTGKTQIFPDPYEPNSRFVISTPQDFLSILGGKADSMKSLVIYIPISLKQKDSLLAIAKIYLQSPQYNYAFFGMRCASSTYEILAQVHLLPEFHYRKTVRRIFYPRRLRKRLIKKALKHHWYFTTQCGTHQRKWEKD